MAQEGYGKNWLSLKNILIYLVVGGLLYWLIFYVYSANKGASMYPTTSPSAMTEEVKTGETMTEKMTVILTAQNDSDETGTATLEEVDGKTVVTINVENEPEDANQPAHIHTGACPTPGAVVYPLTNVQNGTSTTTLDVSLAGLRDQLPLAVNIHKSAAESKVYVACGDLK